MVEARSWLRRYVLRPDLPRKVRARLDGARRRLRRNELDDAAALLAHRRVRVVVDCGAHIGYETARFLKSFPHAEVHAFEPTPSTHEALVRHLGDEPRAVLHPEAVGDRVGTTTFHEDAGTFAGGANSVLAHNERFHRSQPRADYRAVEVPTVSLDAFAAREGIDHVDLLKLDVEGAEVLAIEGAAGLLARDAIAVLAVEVRVQPDFVDGPMLTDVVRRLERDGYRLFGVFDFAESAIGQSLWGNALFLSASMRRELEGVHGIDACAFAD